MTMWGIKRTGLRRSYGKTEDVSVVIKNGHQKATDVRQRYENVLASNFTDGERQKLQDAGGVRVVVKRMGSDELGGYVGRKGGKHQIEMQKGWPLENRTLTDETLTHETVHILQEIDLSRPELDRRLSFRSVRNDPDKICLKESLTEAETVCRVKEISKRPTYYDYVNIPGNRKDPVQLKQEDYDTLRTARQRRPRRSPPKTVTDEFDDLNISRMKLRGCRRNALETKKDMNKKGNGRS